MCDEDLETGGSPSRNRINIILNPMGIGTKNRYAGEGQQTFSCQDIINVEITQKFRPIPLSKSRPFSERIHIERRTEKLVMDLNKTLTRE